MKKNLFYTVMMMAVMAVVTTSLTSCGGSDDDPLDNTSQKGNKQDPDDISSYIWPCTQWGCSLDDIRKYMASSSMVVEDEKDDILVYTTTDKKYIIGYAVNANNQYIAFQSVYMGYSQKKLNNIREKVTKDYGITLKDNGGNVWRGTGNINNRNCQVTIYGMDASNSIALDIFILK